MVLVGKVIPKSMSFVLKFKGTKTEDERQGTEDSGRKPPAGGGPGAAGTQDWQENEDL